MIDLVLAGAKWTICLVYIDDVIVFAKDHNEHLTRLREVLNCLKNANLKLKLRKCHFAQTSLKVLGHIVSSNGIDPDPENVTAVGEFPYPPENKKDSIKLKHVQSFVGMASYYRRFIKDFALIAHPLTTLSKKDQPFIFGEEQKKSFDTLREALIAAVTLAHPDYEKEMEIHCDASS